MIAVHYQYEFGYSYDDQGDPFPILSVRIGNPRAPEVGPRDADGYLDSGATLSLFDGSYLPEGMQLFAGELRTYRTASGQAVQARMHRVLVSHPDLGDFELLIGFTIGPKPLVRNLLGRDFFDLVQLGFREHHQAFYVTPAP